MMAKDILISIENEVAKHQEHLIQVRSVIIDQSISNYPIFVFQKPSQAILGSKIIDAAASTDRWSIFITHLEELYHKKIILEDKLEDFQFQYKNNNDKYCILLIENIDEYSFVFTPMEI